MIAHVRANGNGFEAPETLASTILVQYTNAGRHEERMSTAVSPVN